MKTIVSIVVCVLLGSNVNSQKIIEPPITKVNPENFVFYPTGTLPPGIKEASGIIASSANLFWVHNDGGVPVLFGLDSAGNLKRTVHLINKNNGWEDITKDDEGNLYIGGFGNNWNDKKNLFIYRIVNPDSINEKAVTADIIKYTYEDQTEYPPEKHNLNFDVDALICYNDSLYLFTKNRTEPYNGIINVYVLPRVPGKYVAKKTDSFRLPGQNKTSNWITGSAISNDKRTISLLFHDRVILIRGFSNKKFSQGTFTELNLNHYSHKAGICFISEQDLAIVDELEMGFLGGKIYKLKIK